MIAFDDAFKIMMNSVVCLGTERVNIVDAQGRANMVDVGGKAVQRRRAAAQGTSCLSAQTLSMVKDNQLKKGDVLTVAQIAGIQAAKQTAGLIPLCHPLPLDKIDVRLQITNSGITA
ncbi:MAG: cyclic pyranopterin monophosphate synthase MoaC, partial [Sedimentisphaerales bacterium]|nr:cyclic pyranopterin monophosphate synthase MoaC [Sedimentisphaerales bacterium]